MKSLVHSPFSYGFPMGFRFVSTGIVSGVRSPNMNVSEDGILSEAMPKPPATSSAAWNQSASRCLGSWEGDSKVVFFGILAKVASWSCWSYRYNSVQSLSWHMLTARTCWGREQNVQQLLILKHQWKNPLLLFGWPGGSKAWYPSPPQSWCVPKENW